MDFILFLVFAAFIAALVYFVFLKKKGKTDAEIKDKFEDHFDNLVDEVKDVVEKVKK